MIYLSLVPFNYLGGGVIYFIYLFLLFMAVLGLRFCARAFPSCGKQGPPFIVARGPLTTAASPVAEHRLQTRRLSNCGSRAQLLCGMRDLPRPGPEPVSPALAGRFSTTAPPGKPPIQFLNIYLGLKIISRGVSSTPMNTHTCAMGMPGTAHPVPNL